MVGKPAGQLRVLDGGAEQVRPGWMVRRGSGKLDDDRRRAGLRRPGRSPPSQKLLMAVEQAGLAGVATGKDAAAEGSVVAAVRGSLRRGNPRCH